MCNQTINKITKFKKVSKQYSNLYKGSGPKHTMYLQKKINKMTVIGNYDKMIKTPDKVLLYHYGYEF